MFLIPVLTFAQALGNVETFFGSIGRIIGLLLPIVVALALLYFFWGLAKFILAAGDETARAEGKSIMIWGIVALFVMVSVWGLVTWVGEALDIDQGADSGSIPTVTGLPN